MKKLLALLLAGAMCLPMLACNADNEQPSDTDAPSIAVTQPATDPEESSSVQPEESASQPEESASEPEESVSGPDESVSEPEESVSEPEVTTKPVETTKPEETTKKPEVTKPDNIPASGTVDLSSMSSYPGYSANWEGAGYHAPIFSLGYGQTIPLGHINLANYSKVRIQYGCDGSDATRDAFASASSLAIGLKSEGSSYGQGPDNNFNGDIAHGNMTFSAESWASGARWVEIDLSRVTYAGDVWVAVHNPLGTEIAISAILFTPNGKPDAPIPGEPSTPPAEVKAPVYSVPLNDLYAHAQSTELIFSQHSTVAWGANNDYVTFRTTGTDPYVAAIQMGSSVPVTSRVYILYRTTTAGSPEFFVGSTGGWSGMGDRLDGSAYVADGKWHLMAVNLSASSAFDGRTAGYLRYDYYTSYGVSAPVGASIDVKMIAFFNNDAEAKAYAAATYGSDYSGTAKPPVDEPSFDVEITMPGNLTLPFVPSQPIKMNKDWKAIWLSQFDMSDIYRKNGGQRPEAEFRSLVNQMLNNVVSDGYNTVVVQVRPNADSMYPSEYYPASKYVVGSYGRDFSYDPFAIVVEIAHQKGLDVHAWINPMRGMSDAEMQAISTKYAMKRWYNDPSKNGKYVVKVNGLWYLNPAYEEVRALIVNGAVEIVKKYDVQGVHMDDYFYPVGPDNGSFDAAAYQVYCRTHGAVSVADFRRNALNQLVSALYGYIKQADSTALFGVSPAGNLDTVQNTHCADVYRWCSTPGYIDYICPQIYFGFNHATWAFDQGCQRWQNIIKTNYVKLIIGVTFHKVGTEDTYAGANGKYEWQNYHDILARSVNYSTTLSKCVGITVFSYNYIYDPVSGAWKGETSAEHSNFNNALKAAHYNATSK